MPSTLRLACDDVAALVRRGLGDHARGVTCALAEGEIRLELEGVDASRWLPRLRLKIAASLTLDAATQEVRLEWRVLPSSFTGLLAAPAQHLGVGAKVVDALVERLGWQEAVTSRDNTAVTIALARLSPLARLGARVESLAISEAIEIGFALVAPQSN